MSQGFGRVVSRMLVAVAVPVVAIAMAAPAGACGGLVGENGSI